MKNDDLDDGVVVVDLECDQVIVARGGGRSSANAGGGNEGQEAGGQSMEADEAGILDKEMDEEVQAESTGEVSAPEEQRQEESIEWEEQKQDLRQKQNEEIIKLDIRNLTKNLLQYQMPKDFLYREVHSLNSSAVEE